jgi:hypothetical protein
MQQIIETNSLAYWLHLSRRLFPSAIGENSSPATLALTRATLDAAFQKYAQFSPCSKIGPSKEVPVERILNGLLMSNEFEFERGLIEKTPNQMVLTDFSAVDLNRFFELEALAYEVWRGSAVLRSIGKGADFFVIDEHPHWGCACPDELSDLLAHFDSRQSVFDANAAGVVFPDTDMRPGHIEGHIPVPQFNLAQISGATLNAFYEEMFKVKVAPGFRPNFLWGLVNLRGYRQATLPFGPDFVRKYSVSLDAVLSVLGVFGAMRVLDLREFGRAMHQSQRAYVGPEAKAALLQTLEHFLPAATSLIGAQQGSISLDDFHAGVKFWELTDEKREMIDLEVPGPHYILLPYDQGWWFIDHAWVVRRLYYLLMNIPLRNQTFKGRLLEQIVGAQQSILPTAPCKAFDGTSKQIDTAFAVSDCLVIVECKAVNRSIGYERGDPESIEFRRRIVVERGLNEVDEKARWLATHPKGTNYDITRYRYILPVVTSPFVEFIPSRDMRHWVSEDIPRVLTPWELGKLKAKSTVVATAYNRITLLQSEQKTSSGNV